MPVNKRSVGATGAIGYATALSGRPGDQIPFSGKKYNYEVHYNRHGQIELYYQNKNGGVVHTAECRNEGYEGTQRLAKNMARDAIDLLMNGTCSNARVTVQTIRNIEKNVTSLSPVATKKTLSIMQCLGNRHVLSLKVPDLLRITLAILPIVFARLWLVSLHGCGASSC